KETHSHQASRSSEGADFKSEDPDEPKGKFTDTSKGTGLKPGVPDVSKADQSENEHVDEEEYVRIDEELYKDVNVELKNAKHGEKEYVHIDEELYKDVNVELKVEDDAHVTLS
nr:hypothetical protein [Tanacetum cinerariifolium]